MTTTLSLNKNVEAEWFDLSMLPTLVTLAPQETLIMSISLQIPNSTNDNSAKLVISATPQESPSMVDTTTIFVSKGVIARYQLNFGSGEVPHPVTFTDMSVGTVTSWQWDFGDGQTSTEQNPSHVYTIAGVYTVTLMVSSPNGNDTLTRANLISVISKESHTTYLPIIVK